MPSSATLDHPHARAVVRYGLYPFSWAIVLLGFHLIWTSDISPGLIWGVSSGMLVALYLLIEWRLPYERRWAMTWRSFLADMRFAIINSAGLWLVKVLLALFTISMAGELSGPARGWHPAVQLMVCLLIFEAINYGLHRAMHELPGRFGRFMWRVHVAHHLPPRLYVMMHAVFHPINSILVQPLAIILPVWLMGYDQRVVTIFLMINGLHGAISHFNVDIRAGWMNYLFVGPELHRYHHSADPQEGRNYGATLSIYDVLFGTFVYRPGQPPAELGVGRSQHFPAYENTLQVLVLPFR